MSVTVDVVRRPRMRAWLYALGHADGLAARHRTVGQVDLDCYVTQGEGE